MSTTDTDNATAPEAAGFKVENKITPMKPFGAAAKKKDPVEDFLGAVGDSPTDSWSVTRVSAKGYPDAQLGLLEVTLTSDEILSGNLHERLGAGTYRFTKASDPKVVKTVPLATDTPPRRFGTPEDDGEDVLVSTPAGPAVMKAPRAPRVAQMAWGGMPGWGQPGWAQPQQAPATDPALKAMLEMQTKLLERLLERKNDGPSPDTLVKLEQIKADAMVNAAKEQRLQREAELKAKEAEVKARADADREAARETAKAQAEAAKANSEAAREQAKAFQQAQAEAAKAAAEAAKESARAQIEAARESAKATEAAAKERSQNERQQFERWMSWQEKLEQRQPEPEDPFKTFAKIQGLLESHKGDGGIGTLLAAGDSILSKIVLLRMTAGAQQATPAGAQAQVTAEVQKQNPATSPQGTGTPAPAQVEAPKAAPAPEAPPQTEEQKAAAEARALAMQVMDGLSTLIDGARRTPQTDPVKMAQLLRERLPRVADWLRTSNDLLADLGNIFATPAFTEAERQKALQARGVLAEHLTWLASVIAAVKA
jgi:hypothetical protein